MELIFNKIKFNAELTVCIVDNIGGSYINIAQALSKYFKKVYYHSVNQNPFPMISMSSIGIGYDTIERIEDFWTNIDMFDIIIFPDIYFKDWGNRLRKMGKLVWGGCPSEDLETDRHLFKDELSEASMNVADTKYIIGIKKLKKYLKDKEDKWIKISYFRGNMETFHHVSMNQSLMWIENLTVAMGPLGEEVEFIVEDSIESIAEVGYDGYSVNGQFSQEQIYGIEVKDCCYIGTHANIGIIPAPINEINNKFSSVLKKYSHIGFYSTEIRVGKDGKNYYTDPCMRAGSPPSATYMDMISNWDDIIINGCKGILVEPKFNAKYGCELIIKSTYCNTNYLPITIPEEYIDNVKLKGSFRYNNQDYIIPFEQGGIKDMEAFGSIVVVGDSVDEILNRAITIAKELECYGLVYDQDALNRAKKSINDISNTFKITF